MQMRTSFAFGHMMLFSVCGMHVERMLNVCQMRLASNLSLCMVIGTSFTPSVALLEHPSGSVHPQWTVMNLQGHKHDASKSRPFYM